MSIIAEDDQRWDSRERGETELQRLDRNWNSLLQELRVVQTGVQLLTGFLLTLPFQQRFGVLGGHSASCIWDLRWVRRSCDRPRSPCTACCFGAIAYRCWCRRRTGAYAGLMLLGVALTGMTSIIFAAVCGHLAGIVAGACALPLFALFWLVVPFFLRNRGS